MAWSPAQSAVKEVAQAHGVPVLAPESARDPRFIESLREIAPDLCAVVAYGQILPKAVLEIPPHGCVNVHASLLPKYRGAAPIQRAIIDGETVTGVTTMQLDEGMDTGDILMAREVTIGEDETAGELTERLAWVGAELLVETIRGIKGKKIVPVAQDQTKMTRAPMLKKEEGRIDWTTTPDEIRNRVRGMSPRPGAFTTLGDQTVKIFRVALVDGGDKAAPGTIIRTNDAGIFVATRGGTVVITELQAPGKRRMEAGEFLRGKKIPIGTSLV